MAVFFLVTNIYGNFDRYSYEAKQLKQRDTINRTQLIALLTDRQRCCVLDLATCQYTDLYLSTTLSKTVSLRTDRKKGPDSFFIPSNAPKLLRPVKDQVFQWATPDRRASVAKQACL